MSREQCEGTMTSPEECKMPAFTADDMSSGDAMKEVEESLNNGSKASAKAISRLERDIMEKEAIYVTEQAARQTGQLALANLFGQRDKELQAVEDSDGVYTYVIHPEDPRPTFVEPGDIYILRFRDGVLASFEQV